MEMPDRAKIVRLQAPQFAGETGYARSRSRANPYVIGSAFRARFKAVSPAFRKRCSSSTALLRTCHSLRHDDVTLYVTLGAADE